MWVVRVRGGVLSGRVALRCVLSSCAGGGQSRVTNLEPNDAWSHKVTVRKTYHYLPSLCRTIQQSNFC